MDKRGSIGLYGDGDAVPQPIICQIPSHVLGYRLGDAPWYDILRDRCTDFQTAGFPESGSQ